MAYEYEEFLIKQFNEAYRAGNLKQINLINELKEVYAKAEALNEIINLLKASHSDYAEDILEDIDVIVMDYRED